MKVKQYRLELDMSQERLAQLTGINIRNLRAIENGEVSPRHIKADTAIRLASALSTTVEDLLGVVEIDSGKVVYLSEFEWMGERPEK